MRSAHKKITCDILHLDNYSEIKHCETELSERLRDAPCHLVSYITIYRCNLLKIFSSIPYHQMNAINTNVA